MPCDAVDNVYAPDWAKLAGLPDAYAQSEVLQLFYPKEGDEAIASVPKGVQIGLRRRKGFLQEASDEAYHKMFQRISGGPRLRFRDVQGLLRTTKDEGRIMMQVMMHVVAWLNPNPTVVTDRRENNKPLLREDLKPALRREPSNGGTHGGTREVSTEDAAVESESIALERRVLDDVRDEMAFFKSPTAKTSLGVFPDDDEDGYGERFIDLPWKLVLFDVQDMLGPRFRPPWKNPVEEGSGTKADGRKPASSITRSIGALTRTIPEVAGNPALSSQEASQELCAAIDEAVVRWAARRCREALGAGPADAGRVWSVDALRSIETTRSRYESLLEWHDDFPSEIEWSPSPPPEEWRRQLQETNPTTAAAGAARQSPEKASTRHTETRLQGSSGQNNPNRGRSAIRRPLPSSPKAKTFTVANGDVPRNRDAPTAPPPQEAIGPKLNTLRPSSRQSALEKQPFPSSMARSDREGRKSKPAWQRGPVAVSNSQ